MELSTGHTIKSSSSVFGLIVALFLLSGMAGLVLQVVWVYKLGLVFGNASYATAATLTSFFLGLAMGGKYWGKKSSALNRPLRMYGILEIGVALSGLLILPGIVFYQNIYADVVTILGDNRVLITLVKFLFSLILLFIPTFLMGGTFPVLSHFIGKQRLASRGTLLYTFNTLGAAAGTFLAVFYLFIHLGVNGAYIGSILLAALVGIGAVVLDRFLPSTSSSEEKPKAPKNKTAETSNLNTFQFTLLAFSSGVLALAAETVWIKMFTQVLQNSVYSFSIVLTVFLLSLALGGALAHDLVQRKFKAIPVILTLLVMSTLLVGWTPRVFDFLTDGLSYVSHTSSWGTYLISIFLLGLAVIGVPSVILGTLFPYLLKSHTSLRMLPGNFVGRMVFLNSIGSSIGPLLIGFILMDMVGIWLSVKTIAIGYGLLGIFLVYSSRGFLSSRKYLIPLGAIFLVVIFSTPPLVKLKKGEQLLDSWQSSDGIVTVVQYGGNLDIRLNNTYVLGDAQSFLVEQMQANIPFLIHHDPKRSLFLGMGTGITAGAALNHDVETVDVVEIVADVIPASKKYFHNRTNNLFTDGRVRIIEDDARNYLLGSNQKYDVIVGDLFSPWHSGTGGMYTLEHFEMVKNKLDSGGIFAQWLPLFQLTEESFESIVSTFSQVFPTTTFWRADFSNEKPSIALIGQQAHAKLDNEVLRKNNQHMVDDQSRLELHMTGLFYLGNFEAIRQNLNEAPINNDNQRTIEFLAPIRTQQANAGETSFLIGAEQEKLFEELRKLQLAKDSYLRNLPKSELDFVTVGQLYFKYLQFKSTEPKKADKILKEIRTLAPDFI